DNSGGTLRCPATRARGWHGIGTAQSARCHHHRRPGIVAVADALHHARDLSLHGAPASAPCSCAASCGSAPGTACSEPTVNFSYPFIRRPIGTTLLAIGLFLVGGVAYFFLPVASLPTVEFPTIYVSASRPGAEPNVMAATVAAPLERRLGEI